MELERREGELYLKREVKVYLHSDEVPEDIDYTKYNVVVVFPDERG